MGSGRVGRALNCLTAVSGEEKQYARFHVRALHCGRRRVGNFFAFEKPDLI